MKSSLPLSIWMLRMSFSFESIEQRAFDELENKTQ